MFRLFGFGRSTQSTTTTTIPSKPAKSTQPTEQVKFQNQSEIIESMGLPRGRGICAPLTNAYAYDRLTGNDTFGIFTTGEKSEVHQNIEELIQKSDGIRKEGRDAGRMAFGLSRTPHEVSTLKGDDVTYENFQNKLGKDNIVSYPTSAGKWHEVYLGRDKGTLNQCTLFDANHRGFTIKGSCDSLQRRLFAESQSLAGRNENWIKVARSQP